MARSTIKGITVKIGGDTIDLQNSLKDVRSSSRGLQSELKAINSQLKFDPSNTVLLAQKQEVLEEQIENSQSALSRLLAVQDQVEKQAKDGEISTEQYRAYQREVLTAQNKLEDFKNQLDEIKQSANNVNLDGLEAELKDTEESINETKDAAIKLETETKKVSLDDFKNEINDVKRASKELKDEIKDTAVEIGGGIAAAGTFAATAVMSYDSVDSALKHLQAQTGMTDSEMSSLRKNIEETYAGNFGDDMTEVANVMATVVQQTKEIDPSKVQGMTENLFTLKDTFDYDYSESLRAAKMLVDQFGISWSEAFNLIVQGTQKGLNKNGDYLDSINEYSVHYKQLGYDAEEFINSLENGTAAGTFSVDKIGDAVKEFGVRTKDTAAATIEGFSLLGYSASASSEEIKKAQNTVEELENNLKYAKMEQDNFNDSTSELTRQKNADKIAEYSEQLKKAKATLAELTKNSDGSNNSIEKLQSRFAEGGDTAKKATQEVLEKLFALDDQVLQNQIGVDLFGTMWEDLGVDGVKALMNVSGKADMAVNSMSKIKDIEYDNLDSDLSTIGRTFQTKIINPIGKTLMPDVKRLLGFIERHTDDIVPTLKTISGIAASIWVGKKTADFTKKIQSLYSTYKTLKTATDTAKVSQDLLNASQKANVIGAVVTAVGALYSIYQVTREEHQKMIDSYSALNEKEKTAKDSTDKLTESYQELTNAKKSAVSDTTEEFQYYDNLWTELQSLVDENGEVDKKNQARAKTITDILSPALETEFNWNGKILQNYKDLKSEIDEVIEKKKTEALLDATKSDYSKAFKSVSEAKKVYEENRDNYISNEKEIEKAYKRMQSKIAASNAAPLNTQKGFEAIEATNTYNGLVKKRDKLKKTMDDSQKALTGFRSTVTTYENLLAASVSGDANAIELATLKMQTGFQTAKDGTIDTLTKQVVEMKEKYEEIKSAVEDGTMSAEDANLKFWAQMSFDADSELVKIVKTADTKSKEASEYYGTGLLNNITGIKTSTNEIKKTVKEGTTIDLTPQGGSTINSFVRSLESDENKEKLWRGGKNLVKRVNKGAESENKAGASEKLGAEWATGYIRGMDKKLDEAGVSAVAFVDNALESGRKAQDSHSPSRKTRKLGNDWGLGYILGIEDEIPKTESVVGELINKSLDQVSNAKSLHISDLFPLKMSSNVSSLDSFITNPISVLNAKFSEIKNADNQARRTINNSKTITNVPTIELHFGNTIINNDTDIDNFTDRVSKALTNVLTDESLIWG